jgi:ATP adenylyltransferase
MESLLRRLVWVIREHPGALSAAVVAAATVVVFARTRAGGFFVQVPLPGNGEVATGRGCDLEDPLTELAGSIDEKWAAVLRQPGALLPLATTSTLVREEEGAFYVLTTVEAEAAAAKPASKEPQDAFATVSDSSVLARFGRTHLLVFNKYFVTPKHLVAFSSSPSLRQSEPMDGADFKVAWAMLDTLGRGLVFYNCGKESGASQLRRHLQYFRLRDFQSALSPATAAVLGSGLPIDVALAAYRESRGWAEPEVGVPFRLPTLPCAHTMVLLGADITRSSVAGAAERLHGLYEKALQGAAAGCHNLLLTREWLLVVPRTAEFALPGGKLSINALAFAGLFLASAGDACVSCTAALAACGAPLPPASGLQRG